MLPLGRQFPIENKNSKNVVSENGNPMCKKTRTCEITYHPSPKMHVVTNYNGMHMTGDFKTKLCTKFSFGHCWYGNKCYFAHGIHEVRQSLPPNMRLQSPVVVSDHGLGRRSCNGIYINPPTVCKMFYFRKECAYGDKCRFLHESPEDTIKRDLGNCGKNSSMSTGTRGFSEGNGSGFASSSNPVIMKYRLCNKWEMTGSCPYGKICCFAHGLAELEKPAGHIELVSGFLPAKTVKALPMGKDAIRTCYKRQREISLESTFKQKEVQKISGIYADWIEDMSFLHKFSTQQITEM